ncbi:hypothetical protein TIFTF001_038121 [Ficus carica]|uniref:Uncharacterized protein n=1 Tax=Ficus carica TaxID=3494 RepID=A0AA88E7F8_FICCA|nr:hypothetical protein TIFTF001_038121 [Ficus carica]
MTWIEVGVRVGVSLGTWVGVRIWDGVGFRDQGRVSRRRLRPDLGLGQSWISIPGSGFRTQSRFRFQVPKPNLEFSKETRAPTLTLGPETRPQSRPRSQNTSPTLTSGPETRNQARPWVSKPDPSHET